MDKIFLAILISFIVGLVVSPLVIFLAKKLNAKQNIYEYVDMHKQKQNTPTMGGIGIIIALIVGSVFLFNQNSTLALITLVVTVSYGILGFLDDFLKIYFKRNLGLRAYQKIIGQFSIAIIVTIFAYKNNYVGSIVLFPFSLASFNLGWWFIPFCLIVFLATTNAVNLTDGLDGLAGGVSLGYLAGFLFVCYIIFGKMSGYMQTEIVMEQQNLFIVCGAGIGALMAYLIFNSFPAKIFMGDTGSLALGGLLACLGIFLKEPFLILILGLCFVWSALSVIIQVGYFKLTKKRVFLMAPYHHHLEKKGMNETKIVVIYIVITLFISVCGILISLLAN